eukprot:4234326-Pleurochrysis_carterae.AAC.1
MPILKGDQLSNCVAFPASQRIGREMSRSIRVHARANATISVLRSTVQMKSSSIFECSNWKTS